jgi:hypothetical protein
VPNSNLCAQVKDFKKGAVVIGSASVDIATVGALCQDSSGPLDSGGGCGLAHM